MATLRPINGAWILDWRDADGERHRDTLGRVGEFPEREAKRILKQRQLELSAGYRILNPARAPQFGDFVRHDYLPWHAAEYPASHYRVKQIVEDYLLPEFEHEVLDQLAPKKVERWKQGRRAPSDDQPKAETVTKELRTLMAIVNKAVEWREIGSNPIAEVRAPQSLDSKPARFFTAAELLLIYQACREKVNAGYGPQPDPRHAHMWRLYANTGLRRTEGLILKRAWIGKQAMKVLSTDEDRTKSGKWREIPLSDGASEALEGLRGSGEFVLPRMTLPSLSRACVRDIRRAGIDDGSLHTMRHTYCSHLVMAGVPLRTVQKLAGHSTIAVTERYSHLSPDHLRNAVKTLSL